MIIQNHKSFRLVGLIFLALLIFPTNTKADSLSFISITYYGPANGPPIGLYEFNFGGGGSGSMFGVTASGTSINGINGPQWGSWMPGMTVNLGSSAFLSSSDFDQNDQLSINGSHHQLTQLDVLISAQPLIFPSTTDPTVVLTGPCSVQGSASNGFGSVSFTGPCYATLTVSRSGDWYVTRSVNYSHLPPPTVYPEPTTVLLMGTGLAGIAAMLRRMRKEKYDKL